MHATEGKTHGKTHQNITKSKDFILSILSSIPSYSDDTFEMIDPVKNVGSGQFGEIKLGKIVSLNIVVAAKVPKTNNKKAILAEAVVQLSLSGNNHFAICFGLYNERVLLMEYFGIYNSKCCVTTPNLLHLLKTGISLELLKLVCNGLIEAVVYMHKKAILHNDIKSDNILLVNKTVKVTDFGKATMMSCPVVYNIPVGSELQKTYNTMHRHLAHELRNVPNMKQSDKTDAYSVGYFFKHAGATIPYEPIIVIGRLLKHVIVEERISLANAIAQIRKTLKQLVVS